MIKVLLVEDEMLAAEKLKMLLSKIDQNISIVDTLDSVSKTITWLSTNQADLIFMDIHLSDGICFKIFEQTEVNTPIIFTTAYDEYAIKAFRLNSIDYILKPVEESEVRQSLSKFYKFHITMTPHQRNVQMLMKEFIQYKERITVNFGGRIRSHFIKDTAYFYAQDKAVFLITFDKSKLPSDHTLDKWENMLDPNYFFRVNRKFIINIHAIRDILTYSKRQLKILVEPRSDLEILVPAEKITLFKGWLNK